MAGLLVAAVTAAFYNSVWGVFLLDDVESVQRNPFIGRLWPITDAMSIPTWNSGITVDGRPVLSLTFALNRRLLGGGAMSFHVGNILIHLCAAFLLMGVIRRTLRSRQFADRFSPDQAAWIALACAVLWAVHPLHTASVTYLVQRAESLMGLFYLATLYCAIRGFSSPHRWRWFSLAATACALGAGTKEVIASAPAVVLLWDVLFQTDSWRGALRRHWGLYAALACSWLVSASLVAGTWGGRQTDFDTVNELEYGLSQPGVILHYLRLTVWPHPLVMTYGWPASEGWRDTVLPAIPIVGLLALTAWGGLPAALGRVPRGLVLPDPDAVVEFHPHAAAGVRAPHVPAVGGAGGAGSAGCPPPPGQIEPPPAAAGPGRPAADRRCPGLGLDHPLSQPGLRRRDEVLGREHPGCARAVGWPISAWATRSGRAAAGTKPSPSITKPCGYRPPGPGSATTLAASWSSRERSMTGSSSTARAWR